MGILDGRVACVTGGTRGVGRAAAEAYLAEGAKVVVNGRDVDKGVTAVAEMGGGDKVHFIAGDMMQRDDCEALIQGTVDHYGKIDILHANAGGAVGPGPIVDMTDEGMQDTMVWNFWHTFWTMRAALKHMIPQESGRIIATSSVEGKLGSAGLSNYSASKHAIHGLITSGSKEVGTLGITINAVCPGAMETDSMRDAAPAAAEAMGMTYEALKDMFASASAIKRLNNVEEVAAVCVLLASDAGAGITGGFLSIDGGTSPF
ncbi:MAG TPA: SDR family oxidoreductase [Acidimicrobiales bacterium]|nr:SDR family oxidoreductase [Acidimicrobiales bacterium]